MVELSDADRHIAEIDENLRRNDLSALERGEHTAARKAWYEAKHPEAVTVTKRGGPGRGRKTTDKKSDVSFAADTAANTGVDERTVRRDVQIAESIPEDVLDHHVGVGRFNAAMTAISTARRSTVTRSRASRSDTENPGV